MKKLFMVFAISLSSVSIESFSNKAIRLVIRFCRNSCFMSHGPWKTALQIDQNDSNGLVYDLNVQLLLYPSLPQVFKCQYFFMQKDQFFTIVCKKR